MLIIAIPKSASTSLMSTLGSLHGLRSWQNFSFRKNDLPADTRYLHAIHSDMRELGEEEINRFSKEEFLYKQHIYPTENNIRRLRPLKKVVLLRAPEEIVDAYYRGCHTGNHLMLKGFSADLDMQQWRERAAATGLYQDLKQFHDAWMAESGDPKTLIIQYRDLVDHPAQVVNKVEAFLSLPITGGQVELSKMRYSRDTRRNKLMTRGSLLLRFLWLKIKNLRILVRDRFGLRSGTGPGTTS